MGSLSANSNIANSTVIPFNPQTGATYSPSAGDTNKVITLSNAGGCTVTMPNPTVVGPGWHVWIEARNNAANLITQFAAEKFFINGAIVAGVNSFNLSPVALQSIVGWDQVVHIACDGTNWHVIQGDPLAAVNLSGLGAASFSGLVGLTGASSNVVAPAGSLQARGGQLGFPSTQVPSADVNTLDDYKEGTWVPGDGSGAGLSFTSALGKFTRIGNIVFYSFQCLYPVTANALPAIIAGFPYTADNTGPDYVPGVFNTTGTVAGTSTWIINTATLAAQIAATSVGFTNAQLSGLFIRGSGHMFKT